MDMWNAMINSYTDESYVYFCHAVQKCVRKIFKKFKYIETTILDIYVWMRSTRTEKVFDLMTTMMMM